MGDSPEAHHNDSLLGGDHTNANKNNVSRFSER